jgi:FkbM family methyltransferase
MRYLKSLVVGTRLEAPARKALGFVLNQKQDTIEAAGATNRRYDEETSAIIKRALRSDSNCVDVGCHSGSILKEILSVAGDGEHYAFEPLPEFYAQCVDTFSNWPKVKLYPVALSDTKGETSFHHVTTNPQYSGIRKRRFDRPDETVVKVTVETDLLDNIVPKNKKVDFIKIDVEGAELQVMRGAVETIRRSRPLIVFEHGLGAADVYKTKPENVYDLLASECGLNISLMRSWLEGGKALSRREFGDEFRSGSNFYFIAYGGDAVPT